MEQDNVPDGFVPTIGLPGWEPQPRQAALVGHPVDPGNFYGTATTATRSRWKWPRSASSIRSPSPWC